MRCRPLAVLQAMEPIAGLRRHTWVFGIVRAEGAAPVMRYTSCARKPFNAWATAWWPRSDSGRATALKWLLSLVILGSGGAGCSSVNSGQQITASTSTNAPAAATLVSEHVPSVVPAPASSAMLAANVGCVDEQPAAGSQSPPGPSMAIGANPTRVTAIWAPSRRPNGCPHTSGGPAIAEQLAADLNASSPGFLGSRECPAGLLDVTLQFDFANQTPSQSFDVVVDGCNGAYGPGPNHTSAYVAVAPDVFQGLEPLTPPELLRDVQSAAGP